MEETDAWQRAGNDDFEHDLNALALGLQEARREQLPAGAGDEPPACYEARKVYRTYHGAFPRSFGYLSTATRVHRRGLPNTHRLP